MYICIYVYPTKPLADRWYRGRRFPLVLSFSFPAQTHSLIGRGLPQSKVCLGMAFNFNTINNAFMLDFGYNLGSRTARKYVQIDFRIGSAFHFETI